MTKWYSKYLRVYNKPLSQVSSEIIEEIRENIQKLQSPKPLVTVSIISYNEEKRLLASLWSLSEMQCKYPIEIIGVNNASEDSTEEIYQRIKLPYFNESQRSCGYARQCGLNHARGKYHINIDADTMYPPKYVEIMVDAMENFGYVAACSQWSYIPNKKYSKLGLAIYEFSRDTYLYLQSIKRPELSVRGLVFAYRTDCAKKIGIRVDIIRGEDGSLALGLQKYGKIAFIRNKNARAITGYGTLDSDGSLFNSFMIRFLKGIKSIGSLFTQKDVYEDEESNLIK